MSSPALPADWSERTLGTVAYMKSGGTPPTSDSSFYSGPHPWVSISDMTASGRFIIDTERTLTDEGLRWINGTLFPAGTILYAMYASVGECSISSIPVATSQAILGITPGSELDSLFLYYALLNMKVRAQRSGQQGTQSNLNKGMVQNFLIAMPPLCEQRAIAAVLSDVDNLVESLERLIGKKRDIRTGILASLIPGRLRLPGFGEDWSTGVHLKDIGRTYGGLTGKSGADFGQGTGRFVPFTHVMASPRLDPNGMEPVRVENNERQNVVQVGDILFNGSSETPEEVGFGSAVLDDLGGAFLNSFCFGFRPTSEATIDPLYLAYLTRSPAGRSILDQLAQGSTRYNISKTALLCAELVFPPFEEQRAIVEVLSDMDAEIDALDARLAKTRDLKTGMAQELLSGRTRLV